MTAKPTLGYASRTEAVRALQSAGLSPREIAGRIGISTATVAALRRRPSARAGDGPNRTVLFPVDLLDALAPHAQKRGLTVNQLARAIVEAVIDGDIVAAVLEEA